MLCAVQSKHSLLYLLVTLATVPQPVLALNAALCPISTELPSLHKCILPFGSIQNAIRTVQPL